MSEVIGRSDERPRHGLAISEAEFRLFQRLMYDSAGVTLAPSKKALVSGRLAKRLKVCRCESFADYHRLIIRDADERRWAVDLLTTNETYFFREPAHFEFLRERILPAHPRGRSLRVWSAACSSGEEVYSIGMTLADRLGLDEWSLLGSDLNSQVLQKARTGHYPLTRTEGIPKEYLRSYCLKGKGAQEGTFLVGRDLRERAQFRQINLNAELPRQQPFDVIFLRNVMIYFSTETKRAVLGRVLTQLAPGGYLFIGHSESLAGLGAGLEALRPSIHRKQA